ncbi:ULK kinase [Toxoplasma gondii GT1]|uniref:ULK kinase n=3 Tax=Toxoplasma gondii TaxID=5811 RepID=S7UME0_TOXGG|nr:ULK kinase [Toxoplasma gondii GT1]KAF4639717.1 ULK kinase [Toxoplasma gondii]RQX67201.1 ULK kinase [Toxoplasma gondii CAST]
MSKKKVGVYILDERIGRGSFAAVWKGHIEQTKEIVAVKVISRHTVHEATQLNQEVAVLKQLQHPNIVRFIDLKKSQFHYYLVLEFCPGGDVSSLLHRHGGRIAEAFARRLLQQMAAGLLEIHRRSYIHRDLKPQNLLLSSASHAATLKIADFGFARSLQPWDLAATICGSPLYMAPEILQHQYYDAKADLWSVGAIFFEMLHGRPPFSGQNPLQLLKNIERTAAAGPAFSDAVPLSPSCQDLLRKLLRANPAERMSPEDFFSHPYVVGETLREGGEKSSLLSSLPDLPHLPAAADEAPAGARVEAAKQREGENTRERSETQRRRVREGRRRETRLGEAHTPARRDGTRGKRGQDASGGDELSRHPDRDGGDAEGERGICQGGERGSKADEMVKRENAEDRPDARESKENGGETPARGFFREEEKHSEEVKEEGTKETANEGGENCMQQLSRGSLSSNVCQRAERDIPPWREHKRRAPLLQILRVENLSHENLLHLLSPHTSPIRPSFVSSSSASSASSASSSSFSSSSASVSPFFQSPGTVSHEELLGAPVLSPFFGEDRKQKNERRKSVPHLEAKTTGRTETTHTREEDPRSATPGTEKRNCGLSVSQLSQKEDEVRERRSSGVETAPSARADDRPGVYVQPKMDSVEPPGSALASPVLPDRGTSFHCAKTYMRMRSETLDSSVGCPSASEPFAHEHLPSPALVGPLPFSSCLLSHSSSSSASPCAAVSSPLSSLSHRTSPAPAYTSSTFSGSDSSSSLAACLQLQAASPVSPPPSVFRSSLSATSSAAPVLLPRQENLAGKSEGAKKGDEEGPRQDGAELKEVGAEDIGGETETKREEEDDTCEDYVIVATEAEEPPHLSRFYMFPKTTPANARSTGPSSGGRLISFSSQKFERRSTVSPFNHEGAGQARDTGFSTSFASLAENLRRSWVACCRRGASEASLSSGSLSASLSNAKAVSCQTRARLKEGKPTPPRPRCDASSSSSSTSAFSSSPTSSSSYASVSSSTSFSSPSFPSSACAGSSPSGVAPSVASSSSLLVPPLPSSASSSCPSSSSSSPLVPSYSSSSPSFCSSSSSSCSSSPLSFPRPADAPPEPEALPSFAASSDEGKVRSTPGAFAGTDEEAFLSLHVENLCLVAQDLFCLAQSLARAAAAKRCRERRLFLETHRRGSDEPESERSRRRRGVQSETAEEAPEEERQGDGHGDTEEDGEEESRKDAQEGEKANETETERLTMGGAEKQSGMQTKGARNSKMAEDGKAFRREEGQKKREDMPQRVNKCTAAEDQERREGGELQNETVSVDAQVKGGESSASLACGGLGLLVPALALLQKALAVTPDRRREAALQQRFRDALCLARWCSYTARASACAAEDSDPCESRLRGECSKVDWGGNQLGPSESEDEREGCFSAQTTNGLSFTKTRFSLFPPSFPRSPSGTRICRAQALPRTAVQTDRCRLSPSLSSAFRPRPVGNEIPASSEGSVAEFAALSRDEGAGKLRAGESQPAVFPSPFSFSFFPSSPAARACRASLKSKALAFPQPGSLSTSAFSLLSSSGSLTSLTETSDSVQAKKKRRASFSALAASASSLAPFESAFSSSFTSPSPSLASHTPSSSPSVVAVPRGTSLLSSSSSASSASSPLVSSLPGASPPMEAAARRSSAGQASACSACFSVEKRASLLAGLSPGGAPAEETPRDSDGRSCLNRPPSGAPREQALRFPKERDEGTSSQTRASSEKEDVRRKHQSRGDEHLVLSEQRRGEKGDEGSRRGETEELQEGRREPRREDSKAEQGEEGRRGEAREEKTVWREEREGECQCMFCWEARPVSDTVVDFLFPCFSPAADVRGSLTAEKKTFLAEPEKPTSSSSSFAPAAFSRTASSPSPLWPLSFPVKPLGPRMPALHCLSLLVARVKHLLSVNTEQLTEELFFLDERAVHTHQPPSRVPLSAPAVHFFPVASPSLSPPHCLGPAVSSLSPSSALPSASSSSPLPSAVPSFSSCGPSSSLDSPRLSSVKRSGLCAGVTFRENLAGLLLDVLRLLAREESPEAQASVLVQVHLLSRALTLQQRLHARVRSQLQEGSPGLKKQLPRPDDPEAFPSFWMGV